MEKIKTPFIRLMSMVTAVVLLTVLATAARGQDSPADIQGFDPAGTWLIKRDKAQVRVTHDGQALRFEKTYFHQGRKFSLKGRFTISGSRVLFTYDSGKRTSGKIDLTPRIVEASTVVWEKVSSRTTIPDVTIQGTWKQFNNHITLWQDGSRILGEKSVGGKLYSRLEGEVSGRLVSLKETYDTIATSNPPVHSLLYRDEDCLIQTATRSGQDTCWTRTETP